MCVVTVPKLEPSLPVAFDTSRMEKHAENGWSRFDRTEQLDRLEKDITPTLEANAKEERHMDAARQKFRPVVADFVRAWLLKEDQWREDPFTSVIVVFEDEQSNVSTPNLTVLSDAKAVTVYPARRCPAFLDALPRIADKQAGEHQHGKSGEVETGERGRQPLVVTISVVDSVRSKLPVSLSIQATHR